MNKQWLFVAVVSYCIGRFLIDRMIDWIWTGENEVCFLGTKAKMKNGFIRGWPCWHNMWRARLAFIRISHQKAINTAIMHNCFTNHNNDRSYLILSPFLLLCYYLSIDIQSKSYYNQIIYCNKKAKSSNERRWNISSLCWAIELNWIELCKK